MRTRLAKMAGILAIKALVYFVKSDNYAPTRTRLRASWALLRGRTVVSKATIRDGVLDLSNTTGAFVLGCSFIGGGVEGNTG